MKSLKHLILVSCILILTSCGRSERKAQDLLKQADQFASKAALLQNLNEEEALLLYRKAETAINTIAKNYPDTQTNHTIIGEGVKIGDVSTNILSVKVIPELKQRIEALKDPSIAARIVAERIENPDDKAKALEGLDLLEPVPDSTPPPVPTPELIPDRDTLEKAYQEFSALTVEQRSSDRVISLLEAANAYTKLGDEKRASELIAEAIQQISKFTEEHDKAKVLVKVSESLALTGDIERTEKIIALLQDTEPKVDTLTKLAAALTKQGKDAIAIATLQRARNLATDIPTSETKTALLAAIRDQYIELKRFEDAFALALKLQEEDESWRKYARQFAERLISMNEIDRALLLGRSVKDPYLGAVILTDVAKQKIKDKNQGEAVALMEEAFRLAKSGNDDARSAAIAEYFLESLLQMHLPKEALLLAQTNPVSNKAQWFSRIASEFEASGDKEHTLSTLALALKGIRELPSEMDQVEALKRIGRTYTALGAHPDEDAKAALRLLLMSSDPYKASPLNG